MHLIKYKSLIERLNPFTDSKFLYDSNRWSKLNEETRQLIKDYENREISRGDVLDSFKEYYSTGQNVIRPFALTMVWGFADNGYGTFRTNRYLNEKGNLDRIHNAIDAAKSDELEKAYNYLIAIQGLNISYLSKVLYFATRACSDISEYALIFDIRVARSMIELTAPKELCDLVSISPKTDFKNYIKYIQLLHKWAEEMKVNADAIEMFLWDHNF